MPLEISPSFLALRHKSTRSLWSRACPSRSGQARTRQSSWSCCAHLYHRSLARSRSQGEGLRVAAVGCVQVVRWNVARVGHCLLNHGLCNQLNATSCFPPQLIADSASEVLPMLILAVLPHPRRNAWIYATQDIEVEAPFIVGSIKVKWRLPLFDGATLAQVAIRGQTLAGLFEDARCRSNRHPMTIHVAFWGIFMS